MDEQLAKHVDVSRPRACKRIVQLCLTRNRLRVPRMISVLALVATASSIRFHAPAAAQEPREAQTRPPADLAPPANDGSAETAVAPLTATAVSPDALVTTGAARFQSGDFERAIGDLDVALANPAKLKARDVPKAYWHRAAARIRLLEQKVAGQPAPDPMEIADDMLTAHQDLRHARAHDDGRWTRQVADLSEQLCPLLGWELNQLYSLAVRGDQQSRTLAAAKGIEAAGALLEWREEDRDAYFVRGYLRQEVGKIREAADDMAMVIALERTAERKEIDPRIALSYQIAALLHLEKLEDATTAARIAREGRNAIKEETRRLEGQKAELEPLDYHRLRIQLEQESLRLVQLELEALAAAPDSNPQLEATCGEALAEHAEHYRLHLVCASKLEAIAPETSVRILERAKSLRPDDPTACRNLGALYNNLAAREKDTLTRKQYMESARDALQLAAARAPEDERIRAALQSVNDHLATMNAETSPAGPGGGQAD